MLCAAALGSPLLIDTLLPDSERAAMGIYNHRRNRERAATAAMASKAAAAERARIKTNAMKNRKIEDPKCCLCRAKITKQEHGYCLMDAAPREVHKLAPRDVHQAKPEGSADEDGFRIDYWPKEKQTGKDMFGSKVMMPKVGDLHLVGETPETCKQACARAGAKSTEFADMGEKLKRFVDIKGTWANKGKDYKRHVSCLSEGGGAWRSELTSTAGLATTGRQVKNDGTCFEDDVEVGVLPEHVASPPPPGDEDEGGGNRPLVWAALKRNQESRGADE